MTDLGSQAKPWIRLDGGHLDGAINENGDVFGTYLHGVFDHNSFRQAILGRFRKEKNLDGGIQKTYEELKEEAYRDLRALARKHLDIDLLKEIAGLS